MDFASFPGCSPFDAYKPGAVAFARHESVVGIANVVDAPLETVDWLACQSSGSYHREENLVDYRACRSLAYAFHPSFG